ncbi:hypothetical protein RJG79_09115 [Mycoplasmatota bacterium WC44]
MEFIYILVIMFLSFIFIVTAVKIAVKGALNEVIEDVIREFELRDPFKEEKRFIKRNANCPYCNSDYFTYISEDKHILKCIDCGTKYKVYIVFGKLEYKKLEIKE